MAQMPPLKALALQLIERGPLRRSDDGWRSDHHSQHAYPVNTLKR